MQPQIGWVSKRAGYDGMIEEMRMLLATRTITEQQAIVFSTLNVLFQSPYGTSAFKKYFANPEFNALLTPLVFSWLVGPCATNRTDDGFPGVFIEKCRFLDESGCKGLCVNLCQQPTQAYFTQVLGLPVRMIPNYDDFSCQMAFGQMPLPVGEDPAVAGDCLVNCKMSGAVKKRSSDPSCYVSKEADPFGK